MDNIEHAWRMLKFFMPGERAGASVIPSLPSAGYCSWMVRIVLPFHLRNLARVDGEVRLDLNANGDGTITQRVVLDALEERYPMLRGTIRDHVTKRRRPFLRYYACEKDLSLDSPDSTLPDEVVNGKEPFIVLGSIAGG